MEVIKTKSPKMEVIKTKSPRETMTPKTDVIRTKSPKETMTHKTDVIRTKSPKETMTPKTDVIRTKSPKETMTPRTEVIRTKSPKESMKKFPSLVNDMTDCMSLEDDMKEVHSLADDMADCFSLVDDMRKTKSPKSKVKRTSSPKTGIVRTSSPKKFSPENSLTSEELPVPVPKREPTPTLKVETLSSPETRDETKDEKKINFVQKDRKLVILDIDGLLVDREYNLNIKQWDTEDYDKGKTNFFFIPRYKITPRPGLKEFWDILFNLSDDKYSFFFGIWSSSNKSTFENMLKKIIPPEYYTKFLFIWDRNMCELDPDYGSDSKIKEHSTIKKLSTVLNSATVNKMRSWRWDEKVKNVLIIDNDEEKLRFNPKESSFIFSEFEAHIMKIFEHQFFELEVRVDI